MRSSERKQTGYLCRALGLVYTPWPVGRVGLPSRLARSNTGVHANRCEGFRVELQRRLHVAGLPEHFPLHCS